MAQEEPVSYSLLHLVLLFTGLGITLWLITMGAHYLMEKFYGRREDTDS